MYQKKTIVRVHDTDSTGVLFFGAQLRMAHEMYEDFMRLGGLGFDYLYKESSYTLPMVHCEADYLSPLCVGDELEVLLTIPKIGNSSYEVCCEFLHQGNVVGRTRAVHVSVDKEGREKIPLPHEVRKRLGGL